MSAVRGVFRALLTLWAGSLWSLAAWVAPTLFYAQSDRHLAGFLVARLFSIETYLGVGVAFIAALLPGRREFIWGYGAAALLALNEWALGPFLAEAHVRGTAAGLTFGAWHGVSAAIYLSACLAVGVLIFAEEGRSARPAARQ